MNEQEINKIVDKMTKKFENGGLIDCLRNGNKIADCGCGKKLKAQSGNILPVPADHDRMMRADGQVRSYPAALAPLGNYREGTTYLRTDLGPGREWVGIQYRSAGDVNQRKFEDESWENAHTDDRRDNPNPTESSYEYIERWKNFDNKMRRAGIPDPGLAKYENGGTTKLDSGTTKDGLTIQTPKSRKDLF